MKIITGLFRGRIIKMPKGIRPTQDVHRKALFDMLQGVIEEARFLDLYAGSGAVGLEALSRGAAEVVWVEKDERCCQVIRENLQRLEVVAAPERPESKFYRSVGRASPERPQLGVGQTKTLNAQHRVLAQDVFLAIPFLLRKSKAFDIIFLDPPYYQGEKSRHRDLWAKKTLQTLVSYDILSPNGLVVCQHSRQEELPQTIGNLNLIKAKKDGTTVISIYQMRP